MKDQPLISLAIINIEWNQHHRDYVDNFVPFISVCLSEMKASVVSLKDVQESVNKRFCIHIPLEALRTIMGRVYLKGYIDSKAGVYTIRHDKLAEFDFNKLEQDALRQHNSLIGLFRQYILARINEDWSEEIAEKAILGFIRKGSLPILQAAIDGQPIQTTDDTTQGTYYLTSTFIKHLYDEDPLGFGCFETFVKGYMLTSVLYLPQITQEQLSKNLRDVEIYFDTPFIIHALGITTSIYRDAYQELFLLLYRMKAKLRIFTHTRDEIRNVLHNLADNFEKGTLLPTARDAETFTYFTSQRLQPDDIRRKAELLDSDLKAMRIDVTPTPSLKEKYTLNEERFREMLDKGVGYRFEATRDRDIHSITAINQIRDGIRERKIERSKAILVTNNDPLARVSKIYFQEYEGYNDNYVPHCFPAHLFTTLIWLKDPLKAPDLPRKLIQSACFAALNPSEELWRQYINEADRLRKQGTITEEAYSIAVHSNAARKVLMEITTGDFAAFSHGTFEQVLEYAIEYYNSDLKAQVNDQSSKLSIYQGRDQRIANASGLLAKGLLKFIVIGSEITVAFLNIKQLLQDTNRSWLDYLGVFAISVILIYTIIDFIFALKVEKLFIDFELWVSANALRFLTPKEILDKHVTRPKKATP
ncbi:MAG: hypothetical protein MUO30_05960 [Anaerolineales bacterium]|nr:hypothetical protein [Anaerolineales bacterium]